MFVTRLVTARQFAELLAKGQQVSIALDGAYSSTDIAEILENGYSTVRVRFADGSTGTYAPNSRTTIVDWAGTHELWAAEAQAEAAAEARAERFFEEGTEAQQMQYQWEVEQDERNAAFWGGRF